MAWTRWSVGASAAIILVVAIVLSALGRRLWCEGGGLSPWSWEIWSPHNSQHLLDPYSFTHAQHGLLAYALLWMIFGSRLPAARALLAVTVEAAWEIFENTDTVIEAYRESTIALNYYGDSVLNSVADVLSFVLGYTAAMALAPWVSAAVFAGIEAVLVVTIRDSLVLNIVMLLHPVESIKTWQLG